jgi:hypothetical protein
MKKHVWILLGLAALAAPAAMADDTLTSQERSFAMSHLNATRKHFYDSIQGLSEAQWNFRAAPDRWSVLECAEHIALSEDFLFGLLTQKVLKSEITPGKNLKENDEQILKNTADRSQKAQAPEPLRPAARFKTPAEAWQYFTESRDRTVAFVEQTNENMRGHIVKFGPFGETDAYQVVLMLSGHSGRHTAQIEEVKADPKFPKR